MINITNEDNMALMARYPDKYFDLAIVDPPYGIGEAGKGTIGRQLKKDGSFIKKIDHRNGTAIRVKPSNYAIKDWDSSVPEKEYFDELFRVSKNQIIFGANHFIERIPINSSCWIVWDKINGTTDFADCELAWTSFKSAVRQFRFMWSGFNQSQSVINPEHRHGNHELKEKRIHPTQKPAVLYKWILDKYADKYTKCGCKLNDCQYCSKNNSRHTRILDTHLGSGSIAIACHDYGFDLTACELDKDYYDAALKRIKTHQSQSKLDLTA